MHVAVEMVPDSKRHLGVWQQGEQPSMQFYVSFMGDSEESNTFMMILNCKASDMQCYTCSEHQLKYMVYT